jgi:hypothetical protein
VILSFLLAKQGSYTAPRLPKISSGNEHLLDGEQDSTTPSHVCSSHTHDPATGLLSPTEPSVIREEEEEEPSCSLPERFWKELHIPGRDYPFKVGWVGLGWLHVAHWPHTSLGHSCITTLGTAALVWMEDLNNRKTSITRALVVVFDVVGCGRVVNVLLGSTCGPLNPKP